MAKKVSDLAEDFNLLEERTIGIEVKLEKLTDLLAQQFKLQATKLEDSSSSHAPSEGGPELENQPERLSIPFVADHISKNYHSRHLQERDRHELGLLLRLARYEEAFSVEDKALLLTRLQHYAVVVTAGWKTAVKTSKRAELTVCGIELQAGDLAPQFTQNQYYRRRGANRARGRGRGRGGGGQANATQ